MTLPFIYYLILLVFTYLVGWMSGRVFRKAERDRLIGIVLQEYNEVLERDYIVVSKKQLENQKETNND